ncbi:hypothetical protein GOBAR_AA02172 [Gossypium barbadense]|uniref:Zinc finger PMZ-type domain-containing protein n=1 Tax=Gossypium barbadense TaxID=3634 RepID=A0A2P5YS26_GOSBA|nr:hypothetical protein GOBAR_AA02172 [Gossypium barbadense]
MEAGYVFVEDVRDAMVANYRMMRSMNVEIYSRCVKTFQAMKTIDHQPSIPTRSYGVDFQNKRCDYRRFQTLHYPCVYVVATCTKVLLNVKRFENDVYTFKCTLCVWENEFPVLYDLSTWEVPSMTFELVPNKRLHRNPKGRLQSSRIHNEMDIREKSYDKCCGLCRFAGNNQRKCL